MRSSFRESPGLPHELTERRRRLLAVLRSIAGDPNRVRHRSRLGGESSRPLRSRTRSTRVVTRPIDDEVRRRPTTLIRVARGPFRQPLARASSVDPTRLLPLLRALVALTLAHPSPVTPLIIILVASTRFNLVLLPYSVRPVIIIHLLHILLLNQLETLPLLLRVQNRRIQRRRSHDDPESRDQTRQSPLTRPLLRIWWLSIRISFLPPHLRRLHLR